MAHEWIDRELGGYRIIQYLGPGTMAEVYKAVQISVEREVAIKIMRPVLAEDWDFVAHFRHEAKIIAALEHPHILPVIDFGEQEGTLYLVTRYLTGGTLEDLIDRGLMPLSKALRYLNEIGEAIDYAHSQGIIHRDIKPQNVLLDAQGYPFVSDFGLAKIATATGLTRTGAGLSGTAQYLSPEIGMGQSADKASDIYSLGVVFYEMLTGELPFTADSPAAVMMKHIYEPVPSLADDRPDLAEALDPILARALAKAPADRYPTTRDFTLDVARALTPSAPSIEMAAAKPTALSTPAPFARVAWLPLVLRSLPAAWALGFLVIAFIGFVVLSGIGKAPGAASPTAPPATGVPTRSASPLPPSSTPPPPPTATVTPDLLTPTPTIPVVQRLVATPDGMMLIYIPASEFLLGSADTDADALEDEKPQQPIYLDAFWMDRTEVTVAQFQKFVGQTGYVTSAEQEGGGVVYSPAELSVKTAYWKLPQGSGAPEATGRQPVTQVSWFDAKAYCEWAGRRLPTEAEWDKAARGVQGALYPWGDLFDPARLNFCDRSCGAPWRFSAFDDTFGRASSVGLYPFGASPYSLWDMVGNVWEWVNDWYDFRGYYRFPPANPPGIETGDQRVARGGSWIDTPDRVRVAVRLPLNPRLRNNVVGFRCAVSSVP